MDLKSAIEKIEEDFHLVLIAERMEESLVLLAELLGIDDLDRLRFFDLNKTAEKSNITEKEKEELVKLLAPSYQVNDKYSACHNK